MNIAKFGFSLFGINTYVVIDPATKKCAIIDPGMINKEEQDAIMGFIKKNSLDVTHIINTHLHIDHAIGIDFAKRNFNAPVLAHKSDQKLGERLKEQARMFGMYENPENVTIDRFIEDGERIKIGDSELLVLHAPGHSPGSIALYDKEGKFVITGDALFAGSIGRTDLTGGSMPTLLESIKGKLLELPDDTTIYPGHGPASTIGREKISNPYL